MAGARRFQFFLCSAREDGNTEYLTRRAAEALPKDVGQGWFDLLKTPLPAYRDHRHMADYTFAMPDGREGEMLKATLDATDIVIASPLYWYSVSAAAKPALRATMMVTAPASPTVMPASPSGLGGRTRSAMERMAVVTGEFATRIAASPLPMCGIAAKVSASGMTLEMTDEIAA